MKAVLALFVVLGIIWLYQCIQEIGRRIREEGHKHVPSPVDFKHEFSDTLKGGK